MLQLLLFLSLLFAEEPINTNPLTIKSVILSQNPFPAGANGELRIEVEMADGFHAYQDQFSLQVLKPDGTKSGSLKIAPLKSFFDPVTKKNKEGVVGSAKLTTLVEINEMHPTGKQPLELELTYQACTEKFCLLPKTVIHHSEIDVVNHNAPQIAATNQPPSQPPSALEEQFEKGIFFAFVFVFLGGVLTSFTPCIFPMLPITLAVLGAGGRNQSRLSRLGLSLSYVMGIAMTYSILGVIAASTGALFGSAMQNPYVVGGISAVFVIMALSMYGLWEFQMPAFLRNSLANKKAGGGSGGAFVTGAVAGILASPCVGPVLFSILAYVAQTQDQLLGFALLFTFALGLGQIFIAIGMFGELLDKMPKAGPWMQFVNFVFGSTMIAAALYFIQFVIPEQWIIPSIGMAASLVAIVHMTMIPHGVLKPKFSASLLTVGVAITVIPIMWPSENFTKELPKSELGWVSYEEQWLEKAQAAGKPVMIDFYADWCAACIELEKFTFSDPKVAAELKQMKLLKVDATELNDEIQAVLEKYGVLGLPTLIFIGADGKIRNDLLLTGFEEPKEFYQRLQSLKKGPTQSVSARD